MREALEVHVDRFHALTRAVDSIDTQAQHDREREFGLQVILDGIAVLIDGRD